MGFMLIQNEQRVLLDVGYAIMIDLGRIFGLKPGVVQVRWHKEGDKWMPEIGLPVVPNATDEEIRAVITRMYQEARVELAKMFKDNRVTRFHG